MLSNLSNFFQGKEINGIFFCNRMVAYAAKFSKKSYSMLIIVKYNMYVPITYLFAKLLAVAQPKVF